MVYSYIQTKHIDHVFELTLARPEKRNAFTPTMVNEIHHALQKANSDETIKLVIVRAEGPIFCAGMDLKTFEDESLDVRNRHIENQNISLGEVFDSLCKPSIAIVEGNVIAGGFLIILGCTYVFCKKETQFRLPELALGIFPFQVMASLIKVMPEKKMLQLCLDTQYFDSQKAKDYGIVDEFLEDISLESKIENFANVDVSALKQGMEALKELPSVSKSKHYQFLKEALDNLKRNK